MKKQARVKQNECCLCGVLEESNKDLRAFLVPAKVGNRDRHSITGIKR
jgi:hypothetical protein